MTNTEHTGPKTEEGVMAVQRETARELLAGERISADMAKRALKQTGHTKKQIEEVLK
jgi:plasmid maintenance system antidote protein VapI